MERQKFEDEFRDAFQNATAEPSDKVWTNIELDLERQESGKMKRRLIAFKWLAAASVVFALGIGTTTWYHLTKNGGENVFTAQQQSTHSTTESDAPSNDSEVSETGSPEGTSLSEQTQEAVENPSTGEKLPLTGLQAASAVQEKERDTSEDAFHAGASDRADTEHVSGNSLFMTPATRESGEVATQTGNYFIRARELPSLVRRRPIELSFPKTEPDEYDLMLAKLETEQKKEEQSARFNNEKIWTSVGVAAGSFNSVSPGVAMPQVMLTSADAMQAYNSANRSLSNETRASGVSYSIGVSVGTKLAKRWVLQGGLNYLSQSSDYTSDAVVTEDFRNFAAATSAEYNKIQQSSSAARVVATTPYEVNNNLQFLSFPVQAGYLVLNRDFAIQVNGGVATDLFLQNTITPQSGDVNGVTNGRGGDSPYRPLNFSGLVGSEFSYRFADRYRLSVNPGIRYPFNSVYKDALGLDATQVTFDVGLRFRYIFK